MALTRSPNELDDRTAMGLPPALVRRAPGRPLARHRDLLAADEGTLAATAESPAEPFDRRLAAGTLLGLLGDPRAPGWGPPMVTVPGATVRLGLAAERVPEVVRAWAHAGVRDSWIEKECPRHEVRVEPFRLMRYPVTNREYRRFLEDTGLPHLPTGWPFGVHPEHAANHPVWTVAPEAADAYAAWLAARTGRRFRLPTEAEWEYAASAGDGREHPWGDVFHPHAANTVEAGPLSTTPIGIYPAGRSPFGALDMAGNVEEYVAGDYAPYPGGRLVEDELQRQSPAYRIARGGSFSRFGDLTRCSRRHGWYAKPIYAVGFRLAEDL
jgi:toxoflavin biosynthesis protein ToxD